MAVLKVSTASSHVRRHRGSNPYVVCQTGSQEQLLATASQSPDVAVPASRAKCPSTAVPERLPLPSYAGYATTIRLSDSIGERYQFTAVVDGRDVAGGAHSVPSPPPTPAYPPYRTGEPDAGPPDVPLESLKGQGNAPR